MAKWWLTELWVMGTKELYLKFHKKKITPFSRTGVEWPRGTLPSAIANLHSWHKSPSTCQCYSLFNIYCISSLFFFFFTTSILLNSVYSMVTLSVLFCFFYSLANVHFYVPKNFHFIANVVLKHVVCGTLWHNVWSGSYLIQEDAHGAVTVGKKHLGFPYFSLAFNIARDKTQKGIWICFLSNRNKERLSDDGNVSQWFFAHR